MLLLAVVTAAILRFWQLGNLPPGLYRDEAYNGLDALRVLEGYRTIFFATNNGREPAYIYLVTFAVAVFGPTALAVRLPAAIVGILTTWATYQLAKSWFDDRTGLLAAWIWAVTLWPLHLSRIGLRVILLPFFLALIFWLGHRAYCQRKSSLWLLTGILYGAAFYTYLAVRFTPILLLVIILYLALTGRLDEQRRNYLLPGFVWFALGALIVLFPLAVLAWQQPELIFGRIDQVSIFNRDVNQGDFWKALWQHGWQAAGLFLWRGDTILRHNPAGRPLFDVFMVLPFLIGLAWCLYHWRRPAAMVLVLWVSTMLGPTVLAEDTPHFLRAAGILPAALVLPAIGLSQLWRWTKLATYWRRLLVILLVLASFIVTVRDYVQYSQHPETAYLFEAAARDLAEQINAETTATAIFVDERFWTGWPSVSFLVRSGHSVVQFRPEMGLPAIPEKPLTIYAWPYEPLDFIAAVIAPPSVVSAQVGPLARGDLEQLAYPLYVRYHAEQLPEAFDREIVVDFNHQIQLRRAEVTAIVRDGQPEHQLQVDLYWSTETRVDEPVVVFIHVVDLEFIDSNQIVGQSDLVPSQGYWPIHWWRPGLIVHDRHVVNLQAPYDPSHQQILIGLYYASTQERLSIVDAAGVPVGDSWRFQP